MALDGTSKETPVYVDSSPGSVTVSPVKVARSRSLAKCRKLLFDLESGSEDEQRASLGILESGSEASGDEHCAPLGVFRKWSVSTRSYLQSEESASARRGDCITISSSSDEEEQVEFSRKRKCIHASALQDEMTDCRVRSGGPIYEVPKGTYSGEQVLDILLDPEIDADRICRERPMHITESSTFVVDLNSLKHPDDIKKDEFGRWQYNGSHVVSYTAWKSQSSSKLQFERASCHGTENTFQLHRIRCRHPSNPQFQRLLAFVTDTTGNPHHLCLVSYRIPEGFTPEVFPHGNDKTTKPFYPTLPSTKAEIESQSASHGPKQVLATVSRKHGGVQHASSPCELPRNERQVSYIHTRKKTSHVSSLGDAIDPLADQVFAMMQSAKLGDSLGLFVRETRPSPEPAFILARDRQLDDLVRFCAIANGFSVLTVDPTFKLGDFDVTPITYRHRLLVSTRSGKDPVMIGPVLIHYRKTFHTYLFFAATLVGLRPGLEGLRAFGTDGEKALADAFSHEFHYAVRLTCSIHCRRNVKTHLQDLGYPESARREILDDIFGCQHGNTFSEGLVDSLNAEEFSQKLDILERRWDEIAKTCSAQPGFYDWFTRNKAATILQTMLKPVREEAGLGSPPEAFTTNASETVNSIIKSHVSYKPSQLIELTEKLKDAIDEQEREVERAVIGRGKFRFKEEYKHLEVSETKWFKMNPVQRQAHLQKVAKTAVSTNRHDESDDIVTPLSLSVDVESVAESVSIPLSCLQGIWIKATELLNTSRAITSAPGHPEKARMVMSRSGQRPHLVLPCKGSQFKCDSDCVNFKSLGICSHSVAVAEINQQLLEFVACFTKSKKKPNFSEVAVHGMPTGRGRKGSQAPRKRKQSQLVTERVDRIYSTQNSQSISGSSNHTLNIHNSGPAAYVPSYNSFMTPGPSYLPCNSMWTPPYTGWYADLPPPPPPPPPPPLMAQDEAPFKLTVISGNISKCSGCGNKYSKPPLPPYDLCVQHSQWRSYTLPNGDPQSKFSNAYYHVNLPCIRRNWPHFSPADLIISPEMLLKLTPVHREFLASFGYIM